MRSMTLRSRCFVSSKGKADAYEKPLAAMREETRAWWEDVLSFPTDNEEMRGIINEGHRSDGAVLRSAGDDAEPCGAFRFAGPLPNLPPRYNVAPMQ